MHIAKGRKKFQIENCKMNLKFSPLVYHPVPHLFYAKEL